MISAYAGMAVAVFGGAVGQLLMKSGLQRLPYGEHGAMIKSLLYNNQAALLIITGICSYIISMIVWIHALKHFELSKAYPVLSLGYVIVYFLAAFWPGLEESLTIQKTLGISLIIIGVWISHSAAPTEKV